MYDIKSLLIRRNDTLLDAIKKMDHGASGLVLVVDDDGVLIGVLADADVRRMLIGGKNIDQRVEELMRRDPVVIRAEANDSDIIKMLQNEEFLELELKEVAFLKK